MTENDLSSKVAIVTGSASGIGRGVAVEMAKAGAKIVIADINNKGAEETHELITQVGGDSKVVITDVSNHQQNTALVNEALAIYGQIDILINNAGINTEGGILDINRDEAISVLQTNFIGPFFLTQRVVQEMKSRNIKGCILFTSSVHGQVTQLHPAYTSSKAAIEMFVKDIALELAPFGIRVNAVAPGAIAVRGEADRSNKHVPMGYSGTPEDIANAMIFLASDKGSYITGQSLTVDGGFSLAHTWYWLKKGIL